MLNDNPTLEEQDEIAKTILQQLGGNKFRAMTGARNFIALTTGGLSFNLPGYKANTVIIELNGLGLYRMQFIKTGKRVDTTRTIAEREDVYADDLQKVFKQVTGLDTHL